MSRKSIFAILFIMCFAFIILSLYSTFAYDEESNKLDESEADYNLIYSLKEASNKHTLVAPGETKYIDITLTNVYNATIKYGMYYYLVSPNKMPDGVNISLAEDSDGRLQDTIKSSEETTISIKIANTSTYTIELVVGALVGFENGNIEELMKDGEIIIK